MNPPPTDASTRFTQGPDFALSGALIGALASRARLSTPVLVVERAALMRNIASMALFAEEAGLKLRPHAKTHKSAQIGRLQMQAGAVGLCCAKIGEAEALADEGLTQGLHITSPVVSEAAVARLVALAARATELSCVVDHAENVRRLGEAAAGSGVRVDVLIDLDPGIHRTGVGSAEAVVALLRVIQSEPALKFRGLQFYCGAQQHLPGFAEREAAVVECNKLLSNSIDAVRGAGAAAEIVTGGGTGTHRIDARLGLFTELQVGSYVFMDAQYAECDLTGEDGPAFETSLFVDATVVSANTAGLATLDAGFKAFSTDGGWPTVASGAPFDSIYRFMGDEHGALLSPNGTSAPLGRRVTLTVPHCDPTVNLYDTYHVVEGDDLVELWPVTARGRSR